MFHKLCMTPTHTEKLNARETIVAIRLWLRTSNPHARETLVFRQLLTGLAGWDDVDVSLIRYLGPLRRDWLATLIADLDSLCEADLIMAAGGSVSRETGNPCVLVST